MDTRAIRAGSMWTCGFGIPRAPRRVCSRWRLVSRTSARSVLRTGTQIQPGVEALRHRAPAHRVRRQAGRPHVREPGDQARVVCLERNGPSKRAWMRKLRPWHGHDDHFHARLACPPTARIASLRLRWRRATEGVRSARLVVRRAGAGRAQENLQGEYQKDVVEGKGWPAQCEALLSLP